jgi:hypothetical protein
MRNLQRQAGGTAHQLSMPSGAEVELAQLFVAVQTEVEATRTATRGATNSSSGMHHATAAGAELVGGPLAKLCRHPITLHPIKHGWHLLEWWRLLDERDLLFDTDFERQL